MKLELQRHGLDEFNAGEPYFPAKWGGILGPHRHVYLRKAVSLFPAAMPLRILEVGSWVGGSCLVFAQELAQRGGAIVCVDNWAPAEIHKETGFDVGVFNDDLPYRVFRHNVSFAPDTVEVSCIRGPSADMLPLLRDESFDIVYVDASHYYTDVLIDLREAIRLCKDGGIVAGDDYELPMSKVGEDLCRLSLDKDHANDATGFEYHPGVTLAVSEVLGDLPSHQGTFCARKSNGTFTAALP